MKIALCGPYPQPGIVIGGGEQANARLHRSLVRLGFEVLVLPKPQRRRRTFLSGLRHAVACLRYYSSCAFVARRSGCRLIHYMAFYDQLVPFEIILMISCRLSGIRFLYHVRGGAFIPTQAKRGAVYRSWIAFLLHGSSAVATQGRVDHEWISTFHPKVPSVHFFPNYVSNGEAGWNAGLHPPFSGDPIRILHASRLVPDKGVERTLALVQALRTSGLAVRLHVCGTGDPAYVASLRASATGSHPESHFHGQLSQPELLQLMTRCDVFSFPSANTMEGQSNALTEAMSCGLVPVYTEIGFSSQVVDGLGVPFTDDVAATAAAVAALWHAGIAARRMAILQSTRRRFSEPVALRALILAYRCCLGRQTRR